MLKNALINPNEIRKKDIKKERETGFEPATFSLEG